MTLTAMAKQLNTTPMTIYRRLKKKGVTIDELRDADSGEITAAGMSVIASLFDSQGPQQAATGDITPLQRGGEGDATGGNMNAVATAAVLQAKLDGANAVIEQLTGQVADLRRQLDAVTAALHAEQADRASERRLLTGDNGDGQRRHWWERIFKN